MIYLIWEFFKAGLFAIGGGMATIPFLQEIARNYGWFSEEDLLNMIAVSESTPGAIGINMSTYAGFKAYGIIGGIVATVSLITAPIIIILIIARMMNKFKNSKAVEDVFYTMRPATAGLILGAMFSVMVLTLFNVPLFRETGNISTLFRIVPIILFAIYLTVMLKYKKVHPLRIIMIGAIAGIVFKL